MIKLQDNEFKFIYEFMKNNFGINLIKKRELIESRLNNYLAEKSIESFSEYIKIIKSNDQDEISQMITKLTTNHTYFLREPEHYDFLTNVVLPYHKENNKSRDIRIWSAGCSSGEEAYTTVMVMKEFFGMEASRWDTKILATDISKRVLSTATSGVYASKSLDNIPAMWKTKYFIKSTSDDYVLKPEIKSEVIFKVFNLMDKITYKKQYDIIFCRNVMIYFDQPTKDALVKRFYDAIAPGGYFFISHSESIPRNESQFEYIKPSIYRKGV